MTKREPESLLPVKRTAMLTGFLNVASASRSEGLACWAEAATWKSTVGSAAVDGGAARTVKFMLGNSAVFFGDEESTTLTLNGPVTDSESTTGAVPVITQAVVSASVPRSRLIATQW